MVERNPSIKNYMIETTDTLQVAAGLMGGAGALEPAQGNSSVQNSRLSSA